MTLVPKALEAAQKAAYGRKESLGEAVYAALETYLEHPAANLVERSEIRKGWQELMDERDQARSEYSASQEALSEILVNLKDASDECHEARAQIAALREALEQLRDLRRYKNGMVFDPMPEVLLKARDVDPIIRAALTDTAPEDKE